MKLGLKSNGVFLAILLNDLEDWDYFSSNFYLTKLFKLLTFKHTFSVKASI